MRKLPFLRSWLLIVLRCLKFSLSYSSALITAIFCCVGAMLQGSKGNLNSVKCPFQSEFNSGACMQRWALPHLSPHLRSERNISFGAECKERNMLKKMERNERCGTAKNNFRSSAPQNCGRLLCIQLFNKYNFVFEAIRENGHLGFRILHFNQ